MSFIFSADWHVKTKFKEVPYTWLADRFVAWLIFLENERKRLNTDTLVIGGDLFDKVPTLFDMALFATIGYTTNFKEIVIYHGNHEMLSRVRSFYKHLEKIFPQFTWIDEPTKWRNWHIIPYADIKKNPNSVAGCDRVMSHVRCASDRGLYEAEIDFSIFNDCKTVLLGDIHEHRVLDSNIMYPGAPYDTSFTRLPLRDRCFIFVDDDDNVSVCTIPKSQPRLIKVETTKEHYDEVRDKVQNSKHYYDIEILVDSATDLTSIDDKNVKMKLRSTNVEHDSGETIEDEMFNYLAQVLNIEPKIATKIMTLYKELDSA